MFALTPRAGRSNHRYLVPHGTNWTEDSLTRLAALAGNRDEMITEDCISVGRQVTQDFTGRPAREFLLIQDPRLKDAGQEIKQRLLGILHTHLIALETIVAKKIDWSAAGNDLVVPVRDMNPWQSQVLTMLNLAGTSLPNAKPTEIPARLNQFAVVLASLLIAAIAIGLWYGGGNAPNHQIPVHVRKEGDEDRRRESIVRVAKALRLQTNVSFDELTLSISKKLELLFVASPAESPESSGSSRTTKGHATGRVEAGECDPVIYIVSQLQTFYHYQYPNLEVPSQMEVLVKDDGLIGSLTKIYAKEPNSFDPCGLLSEDDARRFKLCGYPADQFHRIAACFEALSTIERDTADPLMRSAYGPFLKDVADFDRSDDRNRSIEATRNMARFYTSRDIALAERIEELLDKPSFRELLQTGNERAGNLPELFDLTGEQWLQASDRRLSEKALIHAKNDYPDANDDQAIDWLMKLVQACRSDSKR